ncbi:LysR substrate-binding domain-containing protein [Jiella mangrovi]|uniref:LysR family transcriptional regulator n=1 Tax=Jiella mangrovi TaxID=2821407 RepID=A0ABS4BHA5_9HYPH|nr:LysR substrate-binding domain-containing protein [Jiella mangrovi]MBP0616138.1 LysR family transcriptional regulator [Jiella mangrovi]
MAIGAGPRADPHDKPPTVAKPVWLPRRTKWPRVQVSRSHPHHHDDACRLSITSGSLGNDTSLTDVTAPCGKGRSMNQKQITAFRLVMRHGSITSAAQVLNVSQPAVSRLIADLEQAVGFRLFLRQGGKVQPTAEAIQFIQEVERMYYGFERLEQAARGIKDLRQATLHIASMPMVSFDIIPQTLKRFLGDHAGIRVTHNVHTSARIVDMMTSRQLDFGVAQTHVERDEVDIVASYRSYCVCVVSPDHPLARAEKITLRDLAEHPMVALAHHTVTANYVTQAFALASVTPHIAVESQPSYSACAMAAVGIGAAIVDPFTPEVFGERLAALPFESLIPFDFHLIKPSDIPLSRAARSFCDALAQTLSRMPGIQLLEP